MLYLSSELGGIRDALLGFDLERRTPEDFRWIAGTLRFEFDNAQTYLDRLEPPLRQTFDEEGGYDQAAVLAITVKSIRDTVALELAGALGLAGGFNSLDGD
ncbi:hypothetical protein QW131_22575 [Roseibium salinum]|nr:hypothetical protein [Roseibium salinum]